MIYAVSTLPLPCYFLMQISENKNLNWSWVAHRDCSNRQAKHCSAIREFLQFWENVGEIRQHSGPFSPWRVLKSVHENCDLCNNRRPRLWKPNNESAFITSHFLLFFCGVELSGKGNDPSFVLHTIDFLCKVPFLAPRPTTRLFHSTNFMSMHESRKNWFSIVTIIFFPVTGPSLQPPKRAIQQTEKFSKFQRNL